MQTSSETFSLRSSQTRNNDLFGFAGEITDVGYLKVQQKLNKHYGELHYDSVHNKAGTAALQAS